MGNVELRFEVDRELMERLRAAGVDPAAAAEAGLRIAASSGRTPLWSDPKGSAETEAEDAVGAEQRAREWAEANREAIDEFNGHVREHGLLSDQEPFRPRWLG